MAGGGIYIRKQMSEHFAQKLKKPSIGRPLPTRNAYDLTIDHGSACSMRHVPYAKNQSEYRVMSKGAQPVIQRIQRFIWRSNQIEYC